MEDIILKIENLQKSFGNHKAVKNVNLEVKKGDIFGFLGPNGAGKSTTIRMILGLVIPDDGKITIDGLDVKKNFKIALRKVGTMVETPSFYEYLTGYENLRLSANLYKEVSYIDIKNLLKKVGLKERKDNKVQTYSVGMKQRLGLARALLNNPQLLILDEPTSGLDPQGKKEIRELIKNLAETENITFFICTHQLNEVEQICNRVAILQEGRIIANRYINVKENKKWIEIYTRQKNEAKTILKEQNAIGNIETSKNGLLVYTNEKQIESINYLLNQRGIKVKYIIPEKESLEDYYLNETGGKFDVI
ncbi:MAG TPA: ABC transporter ATP-binding protein [Halanaerobiales bacterium]|nr:ABC transporter ATP-binding protein [Halanaerobiales bacterium]